MMFDRARRLLGNALYTRAVTDPITAIHPNMNTPATGRLAPTLPRTPNSPPASTLAMTRKSDEVAAATTTIRMLRSSDSSRQSRPTKSAVPAIPISSSAVQGPAPPSGSAASIGSGGT